MKQYIVTVVVWLLFAECDSNHHNPLLVSKENPSYFTNDTGNAIYLTGSHTWNNLVDMNSPGVADTFDFQKYLDFLVQHNHNFIRLWTWELVNWDTHGNEQDAPMILQVAVHPWKRTGPALALDGKPKFDLTQFNEAYFARLRARVAAAGKKNIYVSIMLFDGWGIQFSPGAFPSHPFYPNNNINSLELDTADQAKLKIHEMSNKKVIEIQEAYVKKVIDAIHDLDNVLFEISNENHSQSTAWQYHMINLVKAYEKQKGLQHPVGMTFQYQGGNNQALFDSPADWISPNPEGGYRDDPPVNDGKKIILTDTDHLWGLGGNHQWVWKCFLRGLQPILMDPYQGKVLNSGYDTKALGNEIESIRNNMGYARRFAEKMNLIRMVPRNELSSSKYCLAKDDNEYLFYSPAGKQLEIDLTNTHSRFPAEWFDPRSGKQVEGGIIEGGKRIQIKVPFQTEEAVLYLRKK